MGQEHKEPETHAERCKRELAEQEVIFAKVREDSKRHDEEVARIAEGNKPVVKPAAPVVSEKKEETDNG